MPLWLSQLARWLVRKLIRIYYPRIEISGEPLRGAGPLLLIANHANSLVDPVMLGLTVRQPVHFMAKAPLFQIPVFGALLRAFGMVPAFRAVDDASQVRRNLASLGICADLLAQGKVVGIFPEGKSHDALHLEALRSGAARLAMLALERGAQGLRVVPIGINYQRKERFRSAVWIQIESPITPVSPPPDTTEADRKAERQRIRDLTEQIERGLKKAVIQLDDPSWTPFLEYLEILLPPLPSQGRGPINQLRQRKRIADAMNWFLREQRSRAEIMARRVGEHATRLAGAGLELDSPVLRWHGFKLFVSLAAGSVRLLLGFLPALFGTLHHFIPFTIVRAIAGRIEAGRSTTALARLGLGLPIYFCWYAAVWWLMRSYFLPWVAWTWAALMPFAGVYALEYARRLRQNCVTWFRQLLVFCNRSQLRQLRQERRGIRRRLAAFAALFQRAHPEAAVAPSPIDWRRVTRISLRWAAILVAGIAFLIWELSWKHAPEPLAPGLNLSGISSNRLTVMLAADEPALAEILTGLNDLASRARRMPEEFALGRRDWFRQADNDEVRHQLLAYLNYRTALLRLVWKYQNYAEVTDEALRLRAFLVGLTAGSVLYATSLEFVALFEFSPNAIRKLNEPEPVWNIPPGVYDTIRHNLARPEHRRHLARGWEEYVQWEPQIAAHGLFTSEPQARFHLALRESRRTTDLLALRVITATVSSPWSDAQNAGKAAVYQAQSLISTWIGDTKIREPRNGAGLIGPKLLAELRPRLRPGDILLERRNWYLSNAFLPGYWPHSALFVGTPSDLRQLGLDHDPRVKARWNDFIRPDEQGHPYVVIESISEGVVFTSLEHSVGEADSVAVLRPRVSPALVREAIARAFSHVGKPYDFDFDFFSTDKLVCTELIFRSYDGALQLPLVNVLGTRTMPAIQLVRKCVQEKQTGTPELEFIAFIDGDEMRHRARFRDEAAFLATTERPALTWLQALARE